MNKASDTARTLLLSTLVVTLGCAPDLATDAERLAAQTRRIYRDALVQGGDLQAPGALPDLPQRRRRLIGSPVAGPSWTGRRCAALRC